MTRLELQNPAPQCDRGEDPGRDQAGHERAELDPRQLFVAQQLEGELSEPVDREARSAPLLRGVRCCLGSGGWQGVPVLFVPQTLVSENAHTKHGAFVTDVRLGTGDQLSNLALALSAERAGHCVLRLGAFPRANRS